MTSTNKNFLKSFNINNNKKSKNDQKLICGIFKNKRCIFIKSVNNNNNPF